MLRCYGVFCVVDRCGTRAAEGCEFVFEFEDSGDAGEVDSIVGERADATHAGQVGVAVEPGAAFGATGCEEAFTFPEPQGRGMQAHEIGGYRHDVEAGFDPLPCSPRAVLIRRRTASSLRLASRMHRTEDHLPDQRNNI